MPPKTSSAFSYEAVKDRVKPAPEFGDGWTVLEVPRANGKHIDRYYFTPVKRIRLRSRAEIKRFKVALEAAPRNDEELAVAIMKNIDKPPATAAARSSVSGPDAGAGHPSAKSATDATTTTTTTTTTKKPRQKIQISRKSQGKGVALPRGYIPTITSTKGHDADGPYVDEDEVTRVYNYPKDMALIAELKEKGLYQPELAGMGGDDDDDDGEPDSAPYRHITHWFLAKPSASGNGVHRMALPADYRKVKNLCLYGELLPSPRRIQRARTKGRDPPKPLPVVLRRLNLWSIDRDYNDRGIWFSTNDAWYKLEQPCKARVYNGQSQADLHLPLRAKFGLVSNLLDMLTEKSKALNLDSFFGLHDSRTPSESHCVLTPKPHQLDRYPFLPTEPFDLNLLQREATFVKQHIQDCGVDFAKSDFVRGLVEMEKEWKRIQKDNTKTSGKNDTDDFDYLASAKAAEKRSGRKPWGCLIPLGGSDDDDEVPRINRLVEIKVEESRIDDEKSHSAKKTKMSVSSSDQPPAKRKKEEVESTKKAAVPKAWAPSPKPVSITKSAAKKETNLEQKLEAKARAKGGISSESRSETKKPPKAAPSSEVAKVAKRMPASTPADSAGKVRALPPTAAPVATSTATSGRKRALSDSDDSIFYDSSEEDEWKPPGSAADSKSTASDAKPSHVEEVEQPFAVEDTDLYPILIFQVKNKCANRIRAFIDSAGKIVDKRADLFVKSCILPDSASSFEFMLAVVESLQVSPYVLGQLFDRRNPKKCGARRIFIDWLNAARERMHQRRKDSIQKAILEAVGDSPKTEEELATQILRLSRTCFDPAKESSIMTPKRARESYHIDILEITKNVRRIPCSDRWLRLIFILCARLLFVSLLLLVILVSSITNLFYH